MLEGPARMFAEAKEKSGEGNARFEDMLGRASISFFAGLVTSVIFPPAAPIVATATYGLLKKVQDDERKERGNAIGDVAEDIGAEKVLEKGIEFFTH